MPNHSPSKREMPNFGAIVQGATDQETGQDTTRPPKNQKKTRKKTPLFQKMPNCGDANAYTIIDNILQPQMELPVYSVGPVLLHSALHNSIPVPLTGVQLT